MKKVYFSQPIIFLFQFTHKLPVVLIGLCFSFASFAQCPHTLPFTEDFATAPLGACNGTHGGWTTTTVASGAGWWLPNTAYAGGGGAPEIEAYGDQANGGQSETVRLTSPSLNTTSMSSVTLSFKQQLYLTNSGASGSGTITVKVESSPDGSVWTQQYSAGFTATPSLQSVLHETRTITVNGLSSNTTYFRFSVSGVLFKLWGWEIDDVNVAGVVSSPPTISSFTPTSACSASGTSVTITGTNFTGASAVNFNGTASAFSVNSATQITTTVPTGATSGPITVVTAGGTATSATNFIINQTPVATATPSVQSVCTGASATIALSSNVGGTTYAWSRNTPSGISGTMPVSGTTDPSGTLINSTISAITVTYSIIPTLGVCTGTTVLASMVVQPVPATPASITGTTTVCNGDINTYAVANVSGATSYTWTLPNGWSGTSTTNNITATAGAAGGNITITANNTCGSSNPQTLTVAIGGGPATPGSIAGPDSLCSGSAGSFSVAPVNGATSYTWTLPNGWSGTSTSTSINATAGSAGGNVSVTANNTCGSSVAQTKTVTIATGAPILGAITGNAAVCDGSTNTYSITDVGAASYTWTLPNGWTGSSSTNSITTTSGATGGTVSVTANSTCGTSSPQTVTVTINSVPATPGVISGSLVACDGDVGLWSISSVNGATGYSWTLPNGWTGSSNTESISATAGSTGGTISVTADNACGSSAPQTFTVGTGTVPATLGTIAGPSTICSGSTNSYSVATVNGATGYTWTLPIGWTGTSSTETISAISNTTGGDVMVTADNSCGSSAAQTLTVTIGAVPATPGTITGPASVCTGSTNTYSIATVNGATSYTWTLPNGWSGTSTNENVTSMAGGAGGDVLVTANNSCGSSTAQTQAVTVHALPTVAFDFSANPVCHNSSPVTLSGTPSGGTFTGAGVIGSTFDPAFASGPNTYVITYSYTDGNNCSASDTSTVTITLCSGVEDLDVSSAVNVYPNPLLSGNWTLQCGAELVGSEMEIFDVNGRLIYQSEIRNQKSEIGLNVSRGVYVMKVGISGQIRLIKL